MRSTLRLSAAAWLVALGLALDTRAATITVVNMDGAGEGFNDPTPVAPVGGNPGTTLGAQRLNAFQAAANVWGGLLLSGVTIFVDASMDPLTCSSTRAVLGHAGPTTVHRDFTGALVAGTWYPQALANKLHGSDLAAAIDDISAAFNSAIGTTCSLPNVWYYGLDASPPGTDIDFFTVVLHEIGHGLGFLTFVDSSGVKLMGFDDTFELNLEDHSLALLWPPMTDGQRAASSIDTGDLHWVGAAVVANSGFLTAGRDPISGHVQMFAPNPFQPGSSVSHWDTALFPDQLMEPIYTGPNHNPSIARDLMTDIGWGAAPCGDVSGDRVVNIGDALLVAQFDVGIRPCGVAPFSHPEVCDVNGDGACNIGDALRMAQCDVGLISCAFTCRPFTCP